MPPTPLTLCELPKQVFSVVAYCILFALLRFGWNSDFYPAFSQATGGRYHLTMTFCAIAIVVELLNATAIQVGYYRSYKLSLVQRSANVFANARFRAYVIIACAVCSLNSVLSQLVTAGRFHVPS